MTDESKPFDLTTLLREGETIADYTITNTETDHGSPVYQCIVPIDANFTCDLDRYAPLEETLYRILNACAYAEEDPTDTLRETMGLERDGPAEDDLWLLPGSIVTFDIRPVQQESSDCMVAMDSARGHGRGA